jgi:altronate hydrolase
MRDDMDINCGTLLDGAESLGEIASRIYAAILDTASGKLTKSEELGAVHIALPLPEWNRALR